MGRKKTPGLVKRNGIWHIDKRLHGRRLCESTGTGDIEEAEQFLARRVDQLRQAAVYGVRPVRTFRQAATKYLNEGTKRSLDRDALDLKALDPHIGELPLHQVHMGTLAGFIAHRKRQGIKSATVNRSLAVVRRVLNLAARLWRDEQGLTWLETPPLIQFVDWDDRRDPYPLTWDEQDRLIRALPSHLQPMVLFSLHTGLRQEELCGLRWDQLVAVPELDTEVFLLHRRRTKGRQERVVVLNRVARSIIETARGTHDTYVFSYEGHRVGRINNSAWRRACKAAGLDEARVHDLRHTVGRRLRAAGVSKETRAVLLGHRSDDITTHYSAPELQELIEAMERIAGPTSRKSPALTVLRARESELSA
jgi:integrase